jgi:uncharacterized cupin superfamily protein
MDTGVSFAALSPDTKERFVALRRQLGVSAFGLNQIALAPGQRGRIHSHERQEEVYFVIEGELTLLIEGDEHRLGRGDLARVAPDVRRQLVNRGPRRCLLLAIGGAGEHTGRDGRAFESWEAAEWAPPQELPLPPDLPR